MYLNFLFYLLIFFTASAGATVEHLFDVSVNIFKNSNSAELSIEVDKNMFTAIYNGKTQTFSDLDMGFMISSPDTSTENYQITLLGSDHQCDGKPLVVTTLLDGSPLVDDKRLNMDFPNTRDGIRTSRHEFTLNYPVIAQGNVVQQCSGNLRVLAELVV